jgi:hypothetical protein
VHFPYFIGHECSAVVADVGKQATRFKPGDLVVVDPSVSCGICDQCRVGHFHTCRKVRFWGCPGQLQGCLCDFIVMPEDCCYSAKGLTADQARFFNHTQIQPGSGGQGFRTAGRLSRWHHQGHGGYRVKNISKPAQHTSARAATQ